MKVWLNLIIPYRVCLEKVQISCDMFDQERTADSKDFRQISYVIIYSVSFFFWKTRVFTFRIITEFSIMFHYCFGLSKGFDAINIIRYDSQIPFPLLSKYKNFLFCVFSLKLNFFTPAAIPSRSKKPKPGGIISKTIDGMTVNPQLLR